MKLRVLILCALLAGASAWLQAETADSRHASLQGRVVKEPGGEPVKKAVIELIEDAAEITHNYTATSDGEGGFEIRDIVPGRYRILIERTGYLFVDARHHRSEAAAITLERGQALTDQLFRMLPMAVLTGRVLDEDGDPMTDANVTVLRRLPGASGRIEQVAGERVNDIGQYRISGIMPGRYLLYVTPPPDLANVLPRHPTDKAKTELAYVPAYYPNTPDRSQASVIELHAGDEVPIDFSLVRVPTARIRGVVADLLPGAQTEVVLRSGDGTFAFNEVQVEKDGRFELPNVAPGSYSLVAIETIGDDVRVARQTEEVRASNLDGIRLAPLPASTIRGQVHTQGQAPADLAKIYVSLQPSQGDAETMNLPVLGGDSARVKPDGSFEIKQVPAGSYNLEVSAVGEDTADFYVETISLGGRNVRDASFSVSGVSLSFEVVLNPKGARVDGFVIDEKERPVANAVVLAMPEEKYRQRPAHYRRVTTDQRGHFSMQGLIPGQYALLAWEALEGDVYLDADFRKTCEGQAAPLRLDPGGSAHLTLKALPAPDDPQP